MSVPQTRHTDIPRSMEFAAACFVGVIFVVGMICGFVLRPHVLAVLL